MNKLLALVPALFVAPLASAADASMSGSMVWLHGTLASSVTVSTELQSITVETGSGSVAESVYFAGSFGQVLPAGSPITILKSGSAPFQFPTSANTVFVTGQLSGRTFTTSSSRLTTADIAVVGVTVTLSSSPFTSGSFNFRNGLTLSFTYDPPLAYGVTVGATSHEITGGFRYAGNNFFHQINSQFSGFGLHTDPNQVTGTSANTYGFFETTFLPDTTATPSFGVTKAYLSSIVPAGLG